MTRRTQALLCFATAFVAFVFYRGLVVPKLIGAVAAGVGAILWEREKRHRTDVAREARIAALHASDDEHEDEDDDPPTT